MGNISSGLIGGLPVTQVIVRSSANIQSGGQTKASAVIHGFLLLACALAIPTVLNLVLASLAAILFVVGYNLLNRVCLSMAMGLGQFIPFMVTIIGIIFTDLLVGIALGLVVAIFQILWENYQTPYQTKERGKIISLAENVSFLNKARL